MGSHYYRTIEPEVIRQAEVFFAKMRLAYSDNTPVFFESTDVPDPDYISVGIQRLLIDYDMQSPRLHLVLSRLLAHRILTEPGIR